MKLVIGVQRSSDLNLNQVVFAAFMTELAAIGKGLITRR